MSLKISRIVCKSNTFAGFLRSELYKTGKYSSCINNNNQNILIPRSFIAPGTKYMVPEMPFVKKYVFNSSVPLNIDPPKLNIIELPILPIKKEIIDKPYNNINWQFEDLPTTKTIEDPTISPTLEKRAARLIVIRRRKMKRHQLKKLRIRMKYAWAKRRQRREMKKEKEFQAELLGKIKEAEKFDARSYCSEKLQKANAVLLPKRWRGKRLPEFVITDLIKKLQTKRALKEEMALKRKSMSLKVSDYPK